MKKSKIAFLLVSNGFAGAERVVHSLTRNLSEVNSKNVSLFINKEIFSFYLDLKKIKKYSIGKIISKSRLLKRMRLFSSGIILRKILDEKRFNILNIHMFPPLEIINAIHRSKVPYLITLHGVKDINKFKNSSSIFYNAFLKPIFKKFLDRAYLIISVSKEVAQNLPEEYKKKTIVIPNGVDSKIFRPLNNIKQKKNVILFVGRYIDIKGIKEIINVARQLSQYEFWFAGQGPLDNEIKGRNIKNLGFKTTKELVRLYNQATICIFPSWYEPFGLVGLEAMSCQRAVIATPFGFLEYIKNGKDGIIIPAKDEKVLKNAIVKLMINEKLRKKLEKNARKKAIQYSWEKVTKQYLKVFTQVIKENE